MYRAKEMNNMSTGSNLPVFASLFHCMYVDFMDNNAKSPTVRSSGSCPAQTLSGEDIVDNFFIIRKKLQAVAQRFPPLPNVVFTTVLNTDSSVPGYFNSRMGICTTVDTTWVSDRSSWRDIKKTYGSPANCVRRRECRNLLCSVLP